MAIHKFYPYRCNHKPTLLHKIERLITIFDTVNRVEDSLTYNKGNLITVVI